MRKFIRFVTDIPMYVVICLTYLVLGPPLLLFEYLERLYDWAHQEDYE